MTGALAIVAIDIILFICSKHHVTEAAEKIVNLPSDEIRNFHEFLQKNLDGKVIEFNISRLMKQGDGFRSEIRALEVKLKKQNSSNEVKKYIFFLRGLNQINFLFY